MCHRLRPRRFAPMSQTSAKNNGGRAGRGRTIHRFGYCFCPFATFFPKRSGGIRPAAAGPVGVGQSTGLSSVPLPSNPSTIQQKEKHHPKGWCFSLAEREGFEPSKEFKSLHDFQSCALDQLSHLSMPYSFPGCLSRLYYYSLTCPVCQGLFGKISGCFLLFLACLPPAAVLYWRRKKFYPGKEAFS